MNLYFPNFDHEQRRVLAVYRYPGEKVCARIAGRRMRPVRTKDFHAPANTIRLERMDCMTGERRFVTAEQLLAAVALYYDRPRALLELLQRSPRETVHTPRYVYHAVDQSAG